MKKILPILLVTAVYLTPLYPIYAQTNTPAVKRITKPATPNAASAAAKLDAARTQAAEKRDAAMAKVEDTKEKLATRAAELKSKLARFRDKAKATRVETVSTNLNAANTRRTTQMQANLDKISQIVAKLKTWAAEQEAAGKDVATLKTAITQTETAWTEASAAVKAQAANDYTIEVNTESTVKTDAKAARDDLHNDLKLVHDKIVNVRQTLVSALSSWSPGN